MCKDIWASELRLHEVSAAKKTVGESEAVSIARTISLLLYDFLSVLHVCAAWKCLCYRLPCLALVFGSLIASSNTLDSFCAILTCFVYIKWYHWDQVVPNQVLKYRLRVTQ